MSAVADAVCITASAVSQQLSNLEDEVGVSLIEKYGRGVRLTPAGRMLVEYADRVFAVLEEADSDLFKVRGALSGTVKIAAFSSIAVSLMPGVITDLNTLHPSLSIQLHDLEPAEALAALRSWHIDIALIDDMFAIPTRDANTVERHFLFTDELYAVLPAAHRLNCADSVNLCDLRSDNWALNSHTSAYYQAIVAQCRKASFEPSVNSSCRNVEVTLAMVANGCSVSVLPRLLTYRRLGDICVKRLNPPMTRRVDATVRQGSGKNPAISAVLNALRRRSTQLFAA